MVQGEIFPSFGMTEPDVSSSDPTQLETTAVLEGEEWVINGKKWFTSGAAGAAYTTVMCKTEVDVPSHGLERPPLFCTLPSCKLLQQHHS